MPAKPPTSMTAASATNRCGAIATRTSASPAATIAAPNSRLCGSRLAIRGARPIPIASPTNTEANSRP